MGLATLVRSARRSTHKASFISKSKRDKDGRDGKPGCSPEAMAESESEASGNPDMFDCNFGCEPP